MLLAKVRNMDIDFDVFHGNSNIRCGAEPVWTACRIKSKAAIIDRREDRNHNSLFEQQQRFDLQLGIRAYFNVQ